MDANFRCIIKCIFFILLIKNINNANFDNFEITQTLFKKKIKKQKNQNLLVYLLEIVHIGAYQIPVVLEIRASKNAHLNCVLLLGPIELITLYCVQRIDAVLEQLQIDVNTKNSAHIFTLLKLVKRSQLLTQVHILCQINSLCIKLHASLVSKLPQMCHKHLHVLAIQHTVKKLHQTLTSQVHLQIPDDLGQSTHWQIAHQHYHIIACVQDRLVIVVQSVQVKVT
ncbi:hypothetical protein BpHYR1_007850 [Brachionus plicatilis]|uniref:Transmembrane protein n=1 Tax=Brachionus plicatilis TaxID=10195 RepID=A0A3M7SX61_BRAPC|nr:hypothetical protein BpHYR1_007850 [Brachionus plicatilis]